MDIRVRVIHRELMPVFGKQARRFKRAWTAASVQKRFRSFVQLYERHRRLFPILSPHAAYRPPDTLGVLAVLDALAAWLLMESAERMNIASPNESMR